MSYLCQVLLIPPTTSRIHSAFVWNSGLIAPRCQKKERYRKRVRQLCFGYVVAMRYTRKNAMHGFRTHPSRRGPCVYMRRAGLTYKLPAAINSLRAVNLVSLGSVVQSEVASRAALTKSTPISVLTPSGFPTLTRSSVDLVSRTQYTLGNCRTYTSSDQPLGEDRHLQPNLCRMHSKSRQRLRYGSSERALSSWTHWARQKLRHPGSRAIAYVWLCLDSVQLRRTSPLELQCLFHFSGLQGKPLGRIRCTSHHWQQSCAHQRHTPLPLPTPHPDLYSLRGEHDRRSRKILTWATRLNKHVHIVQSLSIDLDFFVWSSESDVDVGIIALRQHVVGMVKSSQKVEEDCNNEADDDRSDLLSPVGCLASFASNTALPLHRRHFKTVSPGVLLHPATHRCFRIVIAVKRVGRVSRRVLGFTGSVLALLRHGCEF
ncbi:hypothetical protein KCU71_g178, partial [Aureobasidium melanogenum]